MAVPRIWVLPAPDGSIILADRRTIITGITNAVDAVDFDWDYLKRCMWEKNG